VWEHLLGFGRPGMHVLFKRSARIVGEDVGIQASEAMSFAAFLVGSPMQAKYVKYTAILLDLHGVSTVPMGFQLRNLIRRCTVPYRLHLSLELANLSPVNENV
jgi:hypothetical protein